MAKFNTGVSFTDGSTVTGADLNNITSQLNIYTGVISEQTAMSATVSTADQLLIADTDNGDSGAANRITVQKLFSDSLTNGTFASVNLTGTITSNRTVATSATITTGTIPNLTAGTTTGTAGIFTSGTISTLNSTTGTIGNLSTTLAGDFTITQGTGTIGTAKITPTNLSQPLTLASSQTATGASIDFTGIPSWAKKITVILNEVASGGPLLIQLGDSGGVEATGYISTSILVDNVGASAGGDNTTGFVLTQGGVGLSGLVQIVSISGNTWISSHSGKVTPSQSSFGGGSKTLSNTLDRIRLTTASGSLTSGSVNVLYEG